MTSTRKVIAIAAVLSITAAGVALAETTGDHLTGQAQMPPMMGSRQPSMGPAHMQGMMCQHQGMMGGHNGMHGVSTIPTLAGQDAFGATQEIVGILDVDPKTDWSKVDLEALRQHLIDVDEVTLHADAAPRQIDGGLEIAITGSGRTLVAIQRMIPAYAQLANGHGGWSAKVAELPEGELLTVTASDPKEIQHIRGLGFIGLLASGSWHQAHHLQMAKGDSDHDHLAHQH